MFCKSRHLFLVPHDLLISCAKREFENIAVGFFLLFAHLSFSFSLFFYYTIAHLYIFLWSSNLNFDAWNDWFRCNCMQQQRDNKKRTPIELSCHNDAHTWQHFLCMYLFIYLFINFSLCFLHSQTHSFYLQINLYGNLQFCHSFGFGHLHIQTLIDCYSIQKKKRKRKSNLNEKD